MKPPFAAQVFVHDVDAETRPTVVARGSHKTTYWSYDKVPKTRFADPWVDANYETNQLVGKKGGGFVFDTNAIHKGLATGTKERTVVVLQFDERHKAINLKLAEKGLPCGPPQKGLRIPPGWA